LNLSTHSNQLRESIEDEVRRAFCDGVTTYALDDRTVLISTPFQLSDGDQYTIIVESYGGRLRLTDRGGTIADHLNRNEEVTDSQVERYRKAVDRHGVSFVEGELTMDLDDGLHAYSLTQFIAAQSTLLALPDLAETRPAPEFNRQVRDDLRRIVHPKRGHLKARWTFEWDTHKRYPADFHLRSKNRPDGVNLFAVGGPQKAANTFGTLATYRNHKSRAFTLVMLRPGISPAATGRIADQIDDGEMINYDADLMRSYLANAGVDLLPTG
jgi:hypothetical protein